MWMSLRSVKVLFSSRWHLFYYYARDKRKSSREGPSSCRGDWPLALGIVWFWVTKERPRCLVLSVLQKKDASSISNDLGAEQDATERTWWQKWKRGWKRCSPHQSTTKDTDESLCSWDAGNREHKEWADVQGLSRRWEGIGGDLKQTDFFKVLQQQRATWRIYSW